MGVGRGLDRKGISSHLQSLMRMFECPKNRVTLIVQPVIAVKYARAPSTGRGIKKSYKVFFSVTLTFLIAL